MLKLFNVKQQTMLHEHTPTKQKIPENIWTARMALVTSHSTVTSPTFHGAYIPNITFQRGWERPPVYHDALGLGEPLTPCCLGAGPQIWILPPPVDFPEFSPAPPPPRKALADIMQQPAHVDPPAQLGSETQRHTCTQRTVCLAGLWGGSVGTPIYLDRTLSSWMLIIIITTTLPWRRGPGRTLYWSVCFEACIWYH